jgi:methylated-DNA-protein-cysteine methyltransferase-like protein
MNPCYARVYALVAAIPTGRVMTYGQLAALARDACTSAVPAIQVGRALAAIPPGLDLPWWRVIGRAGTHGVLRKLSLSSEQKTRLAREGVVADAEGRYDLARYLYNP